MGRAGSYLYGDEEETGSEETGSMGVHGKAVLVEYEEVGRIARVKRAKWREPLERAIGEGEKGVSMSMYLERTAPCGCS